MDIPTRLSNSGVDAFRQAIEVVGGQVALAELVGVTQSAVSKRLAAGKPLWPEHVLKVEAATGVSRHDLRPDLYPREDSPAHPPAGVNRPAGGVSAALEGVRP